MNQEARPPNGQEQKIAKLLDGELGVSESEQLAELLESHSDLRKIYLDHVVMQAMLQWSHGVVRGEGSVGINPTMILELLDEADETARHRAAKETSEQTRKEAEEASRQSQLGAMQRRRAARRPAPIVIPWSVAYATVGSAVAALVLFIYWIWPHQEPVSSEPAAEFVATIEESVDAQWSDSGLSVSSGTQLSAGSYYLKSGVVQVAFDGGAKAVIESPAELELISAGRARLVRGRLVGNVPHEAIGFTIQTPTATIIDFGTEFGIEVTEEDAVDIFVFLGEVGVVVQSEQKSDTLRQRLTKNASVRVNKNREFVPTKIRVDRFSRSVPSKIEHRQKVAYERWLAYSEELSVDPDLLAYYTFNDQRLVDRFLLNHAESGDSLNGEIHSAQWTQGRWPQKQALQFGTGDVPVTQPRYVHVDIPGSFDVLTACMWVNLDALAGPLNGLFLADHWDSTGRFHWQIRGNGHIRAGFFPDSAVVPRTYLESDAVLQPSDFHMWHHLVVVCQTKPALIKFFVDGQNVGVKQDRFQNNTIILGSSRIGGWKPTPTGPQNTWRDFHGRIDELAIFRRALSDDEIQVMYEVGRP